jgi:glycosyltransferase involved in cell wall biosynthesis
MISIIEKIFARIKKPFYLKILNITNGHKNLQKKCLVCLKTEPYYRNLNKHPNEWEVKCFVRTLNKLGYSVDLIDRSVNNFVPEDKYDLFFGYGSGNSGRHFYKYSKLLTKAIKVLYATGPEPELSNQLVKKRYDTFNFRNKMDVPYMRLIDIDFDNFISTTDHIFCIGPRDHFSFNSYKKFNLPIHSLNPTSINDPITYNHHKDLKNFLCFAGSGLICKGVDLMVEAFLQMPDKHLHICGPQEKGFQDAYLELINASQNIHFYGFVDIKSQTYKNLCNICSYTILHSAAEGSATSIITNMQSGLIPIVNYEAGIDVDDIGFMFPESIESIQSIINMVNEASSISKTEYKEMHYKLLESQKKFSQKSFSESAYKAFSQVISK